MRKNMQASFGIERELQNEFRIIEYEDGNGDFHFHSQIELCIVDEGNLEALVNNKTKTLKMDEIAVALSYDTHVYIPITHAKFTVLIIPLHICDKFVSAVEHKKILNPFICDLTAIQKIRTYLDELKKETNEIKKSGYIYLLLGTVFEYLCFDTRTESTKADLLSKLLLYIHENYNKDLTLSSLALKFGYNPSYISRYFKSSLNIGITQYINILKLKNAIKLMHKKRHSIAYCALESGFNSLRTFYRIFHKEFHCTPNEYIKQI